MVVINLRVLASYTVLSHVGCRANVHVYSARQVSDGRTAASTIKLLGYLVATCAQPNALAIKVYSRIQSCLMQQGVH